MGLLGRLSLSGGSPLTLMYLRASVAGDTLSISIEAGNVGDTFLDARMVWAVALGNGRSWTNRMFESDARHVSLQRGTSQPIAWNVPASFADVAATLTVWAQIDTETGFVSVASRSIALGSVGRQVHELRYRVPAAIEITDVTRSPDDGALSVQLTNAGGDDMLIQLQTGDESLFDVSDRRWTTRSVRATSTMDVLVPARGKANAEVDVGPPQLASTTIAHRLVVRPLTSAGSPLDDMLMLDDVSGGLQPEEIHGDCGWLVHTSSTNYCKGNNR
jgi:hypothetical protein